MVFQTILTETDNDILIITINRPDKMNALNRSVLEELKTAINEFSNNPILKSAVITGSGEKAFVAGADIAEFTDLDEQAGTLLATAGQQLFYDIENCPKPVIAAVNGFALGGGCELAMACHFRIASEKAKFGQPEVNLGLLPGYGGTQRLTKLIGKGRATELILTGNMIDAITAFQYGLVNHVVSQDELLIKAKSILSLINTKAPLAIAASIAAINQANEGGQTGYETEAKSFGKLIASSDGKEGIRAFLEKRKAAFKGI